jgi:hypothetical protein
VSENATHPRRPAGRGLPFRRITRCCQPSSKKKLKKTLHQRHGDRSSGVDDAGDDAKLPVYCRFADLIEAGIATNWPQLLRMIDNQGFPEGIWLSANIRAWEVASVRRWLAQRPTARKQILKPYRQKEATA